MLCKYVLCIFIDLYVCVYLNLIPMLGLQLRMMLIVCMPGTWLVLISFSLIMRIELPYKWYVVKFCMVRPLCLQYKCLHKKGSGLVYQGKLFLTPPS